VTSIIAILAAMLLPALSTARRQAYEGLCISNQRQLAVATSLYLSTYDGFFFPYYTDDDAGRQWWFGFEAGGPGTGENRPLDKSRGVLAPFVNSIDARLECPSFPYDSPTFYRKFAVHSATYGYNIRLLNQRGSRYINRASEVFMFADGIHFDFVGSFNEGHYIMFPAWEEPPGAYRTGYAHFRHDRAAIVMYQDGHIAAQRMLGQPFDNTPESYGCSWPAGNLFASDGTVASIDGR